MNEFQKQSEFLIMKHAFTNSPWKLSKDMEGSCQHDGP
jgi:hypothetical protein